MKDQNKYYMQMAKHVASASYCERSKVGAILVKDNNVIAMGYNGTPAGFPNTCEFNNNPDITKAEVLHAETNAIAKCARSTQSSEGACLYVTVSPCFDCAKLIIQCGIVRVYWNEPYRKMDGIDLLREAGIPTQQIDI